MDKRRKEEIELIQKNHGHLETGPSFEWVLIKNWQLPPGWNKPETNVLVFVPPGYPVTPPDNFFADNDLRLSSGRQPGNTTPNQSHQGSQWLQFSYHVEKADWKPHADILQGHNLLTFLTGVSKRLSEVV